MHIFITGAAGFIGSHLTETLLKEGHSIVGIDNFNDFYEPKIKERNIQSALLSSAFSLIKGDILDQNIISNIFNNNCFDAVIHLAAYAGVRPSIENPILYQRVNNEGTTILLSETAKHKIQKFIFASSSSVYGERIGGPFRETDDVNDPVSPYAATKKAGELLCYTFHHLYNIDISCLRFFTVYGPRQRPEMAIHKFAKQIFEQKLVTLYGDGSSSRDYTFIDDIISGVIQSLHRAKGYHIYNLGNSQTIKLIDMINTLSGKMNIPAHIEFLPNQAGDVPLTFADISLAKRELDYHPHTNIDHGLEIFVKWFFENNKKLQK